LEKAIVAVGQAARVETKNHAAIIDEIDAVAFDSDG